MPSQSFENVQHNYFTFTNIPSCVVVAPGVVKVVLPEVVVVLAKKREGQRENINLDNLFFHLILSPVIKPFAEKSFVIVNKILIFICLILFFTINIIMFY